MDEPDKTTGMDKLERLSGVLLVALTLSMWVESVDAQSTLQSVVDQIERNNQNIAVEQLEVAADQLSYRTGNTPEDLRIGYDFLKGGLGSGDQTEIIVAQAFDFPTVYAKRKKLADARVSTSDQLLASKVNSIRLQATKVCLRLIYERKRQKGLMRKREATENILRGFEERLVEGASTKLDVGKSKLQLIGLERELAEARTKELALLAELQQLNGGKEITFADTVYPKWGSMSSDTLKAKWEQSDPVHMLLTKQNEVAEQEIALSKAMWLPKLEAGFRHVSGFGQLFNGVHTGISLPIWERRNTVKAKKAEQQAMVLNAEMYSTTKTLELNRLLQEQTVLKEMIDEYDKVLSEVRNLELLQAALELGRINTTEYFIEVNTYHEAIEARLTTELQYQEVQASINRYGR